MNLEDRKLLKDIELHCIRGEVNVVSNLIKNRLTGLALFDTIIELKCLLMEEKYDEMIDRLSFYRQIYPGDNILMEMETQCLVMSCLEK